MSRLSHKSSASLHPGDLVLLSGIRELRELLCYGKILSKQALSYRTPLSKWKSRSIQKEARTEILIVSETIEEMVRCNDNKTSIFVQPEFLAETR